MPTTVEEVYARHSGDVFRFAYWLCGDREEAQDILSETFIRLWAGEGEVRTATVKAYFFTIARNLFRQRARQRNRERTLDEDLPSRLPATDARAEARDELDAVARILRELPESDRSALLMRAHHGTLAARSSRASAPAPPILPRPERIVQSSQSIDGDRLHAEQHDSRHQNGELQRRPQKTERHDERGGTRRRVRRAEEHHESTREAQRQRGCANARRSHAAADRRSRMEETERGQTHPASERADEMTYHRVARTSSRRERRVEEQKRRGSERWENERLPAQQRHRGEERDGDEAVDQAEYRQHHRRVVPLGEMREPEPHEQSAQHVDELSADRTRRRGWRKFVGLRHA